MKPNSISQTGRLPMRMLLQWYILIHVELSLPTLSWCVSIRNLVNSNWNSYSVNFCNRASCTNCIRYTQRSLMEYPRTKTRHRVFHSHSHTCEDSTQENSTKMATMGEILVEFLTCEMEQLLPRLHLQNNLDRRHLVKSRTIWLLHHQKDANATSKGRPNLAASPNPWILLVR